MARPVLMSRSLGHLVALAAVAIMCLTSAAEGQPSFDAGSQLPDATNSKTLAEGRALILADPVDVQILRAVSPATGPALTAVRNDPLLSTALAATVGLSTPFGELSERVLPGVEKSVGTYLLTNNATRSAFDAIAASPTTAAVLAATSSWTPTVGGLISDSSDLMTDVLPFDNAGRRLMQSALVAGGAVPLATGAAAAGSLLATFLQGGINALNALSTSLTDVASAALAGQAVALVAKVAPAAVAAVRAAVTAGAVIKAKVAGTATSNEQASSASTAGGRRMLQSDP